MLVWLAELLTPHFTFFNVFSYLTFRAILFDHHRSGGGALDGAAPHPSSADPEIRSGDPQRRPRVTPQQEGHPTMGGLMIIAAIFISVLLWSRLDNPYVWLVLFVLGAYGAIGFADDYLKVVRKNTDGLIAAGSTSGNPPLPWPWRCSSMPPRPMTVRPSWWCPSSRM